MATSHETQDPILDEIVRRLVLHLAPRQILLFGSRARGDARADSDYDLLLVMPFEGRRLDAALAARSALRGLPISKDLVVLRPHEFEAWRDVPGTIAWPAWHEGRVLHAA